MTLQKKLKIAVLVLMVITAVVGLSLHMGISRCGNLQELQDTVAKARACLIDLNTLIMDNFLVFGERSRWQWELKHKEFNGYLEYSVFKTPAHQGIFSKLKSKNAELSDTFKALCNVNEDFQSGRITLKASEPLIQDLTTRLIMVSKAMLSQMSRAEKKQQGAFNRFQTRMGYVIALMFIGMTGLMTILLFSFHRTVIKPIQLLEKSIQSITQNRYAGEIKIKKKDEIGLLADSYNQMARTIRDRESALRKSEERYRSLIENLPVGLYRNTPGEEGRFVMANPALVKMHGYDTMEAFLRTSVADLYMNPADRKAFSDKLIAQGSIVSEELMLKKQDGTPIWGALTVSVVRDESGEIIYFDGMVENITERKKIETALRESESRFRSLFDLSPQAISLAKGEDGTLIDVNDNFCRLTKYTKNELIGSTSIEFGFSTKENRDRFIRKLRESGSVHGLEMDFRIKDGSIINALVFSRIIKISDTDFILTILLDMTERKQLETQIQQMRKMESIGTLAGGIAHDFNNILGIIIGNTELAIADVPEWNTARRNLEEVRTACFRARDVVKQILAFSRKNTNELKAVKLGPIIKDTIKLLRSSIPTTIEMHQDISLESDSVCADPTQINQILLNLCGNAAHAMREKGGVLEVCAENVKLDHDAINLHRDLAVGNYVKLSVTDTGCGMEPPVLKRIFEPYYTTKRFNEGSGMGIAVVHGIVKSHGGDILAKSEPGKGTTFEVFLTCSDDAPEDKIKGTEEIPRGNERILFVDDEKAIVDTIQPMMERLGYRVVARTSSIEALQAFRAKPDEYDLVVTDYTMPNMNGVELSKTLMQVRPDLPIILCTGYSEQINEKKAKGKGIRAFMMKPVTMDEMAKAIRKALKAGEISISH